MKKSIPTYLIKLRAKMGMRGRRHTLLRAMLLELGVILGLSVLLVALIPGGVTFFERMTTGAFTSAEEQLMYQMEVRNKLMNVVAVVSVLFSFVTVGGVSVALDVVRGKKTKARKVFSFYGKWYIAALWPLAINLVSFALSSIVSYLDKSPVNGAIVVLVAFLMDVVLIVLQCKMLFINYALADNGCTSFKEAAMLSWRMSNLKAVINVFVLSLSFIGWIFFSIGTFGIGFIYSGPYMLASNAALYDMIKAQMTGTEEPSEE